MKSETNQSELHYSFNIMQWFFRPAGKNTLDAHNVAALAFLGQITRNCHGKSVSLDAVRE